ncbi:MAG: GTPase [Actinocatenispora sp.]
MIEQAEPFLGTPIEPTMRSLGAGRRGTAGDADGSDDERPGRESGPDGLRRRLRALNRLVTELGTRVPEKRLAPARDLIGRAGQRLEMSSRHTVVALAGTTGSGKSTLFNALTGLDLSRVGVRRPTTTEVHACVWDPDGSDELLDWLAVPARRRTARESALDGEEQAELRGLVLMDLPDFDSIDQAHRHEVDRLVGVVDMVIWVVDPQKYADRTVHERYLRALGSRGASTAVVLNQVDRLTPVDAQRCGDDLRRLLVEDGLPPTALRVTSARTGAGVPELRKVLAAAVADRQASVRRLTTDMTTVAAGLEDLTGPEVGVLEAAPLDELSAELAALAGVPGLLDGAAGNYRRRGQRATGWLFVRRLLGGRDPKRRLEQERYDLDWLESDSDSDGDGDEERPVPVAAPQAGAPPVGLADLLRGYVDHATKGLPEPWPGSVRSVVQSRTAELAERLQRLPARATARPSPGWWGTLTVLQWVLGGCAAVGLLWLVAAALSGPLGLSGLPDPHVGPLPLSLLLLAAGLVAGLLAAAVAVPMVRSGANEYRQRLAENLGSEATAAARDCVVDPVREELYVYQKARTTGQDLRDRLDGTSGTAGTATRTLS